MPITPQIARKILKWSFPVAFNFVFLAICGFSENEVSRWISFVFINLSWFLREYTRTFTSRNKGLKVLSYSLHGISTSFFLLTLFTGIVFIMRNGPEYGLPLVIHTVILLVYIFLFLPTYIANEHTVNNIQAAKNEPALLVEATQKLLAIQNSNSREINCEIKKCMEYLQFTPHASSLAAISQDQKITSIVEQIIVYSKNNDLDKVRKLANDLDVSVRTRNEILKNSH